MQYIYGKKLCNYFSKALQSVKVMISKDNIYVLGKKKTTATEHGFGKNKYVNRQ